MLDSLKVLDSLHVLHSLPVVSSGIPLRDLEVLFSHLLDRRGSSVDGCDAGYRGGCDGFSGRSERSGGQRSDHEARTHCYEDASFVSVG